MDSKTFQEIAEGLLEFEMDVAPPWPRPGIWRSVSFRREDVDFRLLPPALIEGLVSVLTDMDIDIYIEEVGTRHVVAAGWKNWCSALKSAHVRAGRVLAVDQDQEWIIFSDNDFTALFGRDAMFKLLIEHLKDEGHDLLTMTLQSWSCELDIPKEFCRQIGCDYEGRTIQEP
jgi:hypothetical protein